MFCFFFVLRLKTHEEISACIGRGQLRFDEPSFRLANLIRFDLCIIDGDLSNCIFFDIKVEDEPVGLFTNLQFGSCTYRHV